jgi:hypothetical protein
VQGPQPDWKVPSAARLRLKDEAASYYVMDFRHSTASAATAAPSAMSRTG